MKLTRKPGNGNSTGKGWLLLIKVTEKATEKLKQALVQQDKEDAYIRVFVSGMG